MRGLVAAPSHAAHIAIEANYLFNDTFNSSEILIYASRKHPQIQYRA